MEPTGAAVQAPTTSGTPGTDQASAAAEEAEVFQQVLDKVAVSVTQLAMTELMEFAKEE